MQTRGAILRKAPGKYEVVDGLELDDPRPGELQVRMVASGLCHSDDHIATGDIPAGIYPMAGGHEGDHVVFSFLPGCGRCRWCATGHQNLCDLGRFLLAGCRPDDPTSYRLSLDGAPVGQMSGISTFCENTTVSVHSAVKISKDIPLQVACLTGCSVGTGWGSAVNSAAVQQGQTVIVMGIGGIGANAVQGAVHAGAANVIAVDPVAFKREKAKEFGATHAFESMEEATEIARSFTNGQGADSAIVTVGVTKSEHVAAAFAAIRKQGTCVVTGLGNITDVGVNIPLGELTLFQKRLQGSLFGESAPSFDIPRQLELYQAGLLKLDELVTTTYRLDEINQGYDDMHAGRNIRGVIRYDA